jgi:hypothetical protein
MLRQLSTDSVSSINSLSSACSLSSSAHAPDTSTTSSSKKKKKGWVSIALCYLRLVTCMLPNVVVNTTASCSGCQGFKS